MAEPAAVVVTQANIDRTWKREPKPNEVWLAQANRSNMIVAIVLDDEPLPEAEA